MNNYSNKFYCYCHFSCIRLLLYHSSISYKKQIEDAEEIAALNLAKYRKSQQQLEEADERSQAAESNMVRMRAGTPSTDRIAEIRNEHGRFMSPFFVSDIKI